MTLANLIGHELVEAATHAPADMGRYSPPKGGAIMDVNHRCGRGSAYTRCLIQHAMLTRRNTACTCERVTGWIR